MSEDQGANQGYSFIALVISSGILGYLIDKFANTAPWGLLSFLVIGIVYATYKAQKAMNPNGASSDDKKGGKKE